MGENTHDHEQLLEDERAWRAQVLHDRCRASATAVAGFAAVTALLDPVGLPTWWHVEVALGARAAVIGAIAVGLLLTHRQRWALTWAWPITWMGAMALAGFTGAATATMGGVDEPWVYLGYLLPLWTAALPLTRWARALGNVGVSAAWWGAVLVVRPETTTSPALGTILGVATFSTVLLGWLGALLWQAERHGFRDRWWRARREAQLAEANADLAHRVAARTRELQEALSRLEDARETERRELAGMLHDELGQQLTALRLTVATRLGGQPDVAALLESRLDEVHEAVYRVLQRLAPRALAVLGFEQAVTQMVDEVGRSSGLRVQVELDGPLEELPDGLALDAFRALQEGVTNAVRHAQATRLHVRAMLDGDHLHLTVEDDGRGVALDRPSEQLGLAGIEERARARGGEMRLTSAPQDGTRLVVQIPVLPEVSA